MSNKKFIGIDEVYEMIETHIKQHDGSMRAFGRNHSMTPSYISNIMSAVRMPSKKMLDAVGLEAVVVYRRKPEAATGRTKSGAARSTSRKESQRKAANG